MKKHASCHVVLNLVNITSPITRKARESYASDHHWFATINIHPILPMVAFSPCSVE